MSPRIVFAALTVAVIGAVSFPVAPGYAQAPEDSAKAKASALPASENASSEAKAAPTADAKVGKASFERSADASNGKASLAAPVAAASK